jgi:hypothetical protein
VSTRVTIEFGGEQVPADELEFKTEKEDWNSYLAEDGVTVKLKHVVAKIYRLVDKQHADGSPVYVVAGNVLLTKTEPQAERAPEPESEGVQSK